MWLFLFLLCEAHIESEGHIEHGVHIVRHRRISTRGVFKALRYVAVFI